MQQIKSTMNPNKYKYQSYRYIFMQIQVTQIKKINLFPYFIRFCNSNNPIFSECIVQDTDSNNESIFSYNLKSILSHLH